MENYFVVTKNRFGWFLTATEFSVYFTLACIERIMTLGPVQAAKIQLRWEYVALGFVQCLTHGLGNISLQYLDFPTKVIFKSCKLIMVLIGSRLVFKEAQTPRDYLSAVIVCLGLIVFTLADASASPKFNFFGIILIMISLCGEVFLSTLTEKAMQRWDNIQPITHDKEFESIQTRVITNKPDDISINQNLHASEKGFANSEQNSRTELMVCEYLMASSLMMLIASLSGDLLQAIDFFQSTSMIIKATIPFYATVTYLGVCCAISIVNRFGSVAVTYVTSCRRMFSLVISFLFFPKTVLMGHIFGIIMVGVGVSFLDVAKDQQKKAARDRNFYEKRSNGEVDTQTDY
jgi:adenosine 3'-phospho 5'-phosphosulfate transporter B3